MIRYSARAFKALVYLFGAYNDLDVYVEDTTCRNMYEMLLNRILAGRARVVRVFQVGGREKVLEICREMQGERKRKWLCVIDADFDLLLDIPRPNLRNLYRLQVFDAENLLVCETACVEVGVECQSNASRDELKRRIGYGEYQIEGEKQLIPLYIAYAVVRKMSLGHEGTSKNVTTMCTRDGKELRLHGETVRAVRSEVLRKITEMRGAEATEGALQEIAESAKRRRLGLLAAVSGKNCLLPLMLHRLRARVGYKGGVDELRVRLARHCTLGNDKGLAKALVGALR